MTYYYTTFIKFGIGRATYDAAQEIRSKDIDRDEGVALVKKFDGELPTRFLNELFEYLSINKKIIKKLIICSNNQILMKSALMTYVIALDLPIYGTPKMVNGLRKTVFE